MFRTTVYIPSSMWDAFNAQNKTASLAYFIQLKSIHRTPIFYNYNKKIVAAKLGVSLNCLKKHVSVLIEMGVAQIKDGHLKLMGINPLKRKYAGSSKNPGKISYINVQKTIKDTKVLVQSFPILCNLSRQCKKVTEQDRLNATKANQKGSTKFGYLTLSNKKALDLLQRKSLSTIQRAKKKLRKLNVLNYRSKYMPYDQYRKFFENPPKESQILRFDGKLYVQLSNQYVLIGKEYNNEYIVSTPSYKKNPYLLTTSPKTGISLVGVHYLTPAVKAA